MSLAKVVEFIDTIELVKYNSDKNDSIVIKPWVGFYNWNLL